jgi:Ras family protein
VQCLSPLAIRLSRRTGKSSLTSQFIDPNSFNESYYPTIESTHTKVIKHEGITYECEIIDTAGQVSQKGSLAIPTSRV